MRNFSNLVLTFVITFIAASQLYGQNRQTIDSLFREIKTEKSENQKAFLYSLIAEQYYSNYPDSALKYSYMGMFYSYRNHNVSDLAYFHNLIGVIFKNKSEYDSALYHFDEAIKLNEIDTFYRGVAANLNNIGQVYLMKADYDKALDSYLKSLEIFEKFNDTLNIGELHSNIGALMIKINEFDAAEEHFKLSRKQYIMAGAKLQEAWILYDLGNLKLKSGELDEALLYFTESARVWKSFDRIKGYYNCVMRIGEVLMQKNNYGEAENLFSQALGKFSGIDNQQGIAEALMLLGRAQFHQNKLRFAVENQKKAIQLSDHFDSKQMKLDLYFDIYQTYKSLRSADSALYYLERYKQLNDTVFSESRNQLIAEYQTKLNLNNKETIIKQLEDEKQRQELINENILLQSQKRQLGIYALAFVIVISILFVFSLFRRHKKTNKLNKELEASLKEREVLVREVHHRVKNNLQIISSLLNLQSEKTEGSNAKEILQLSQSRIEAMSMIHENLYKSSNLSEISFRDYINNLCEYIEISFNLSGKGVSLSLDIDEIEVDIDQLVPCGLIINELVTNSIKHAFVNVSNGEIKIGCHANENLIRIEIKDNGPGLPENFNLAETKSLGMRLAQGLARQLKSELHFGNHNGFVAWFEFNSIKR
ncbi:hypothetical protein SDC9_53755 [bioreactor metagenome]|uniref:histidine kinase n=1 Tax=bioreactor metagenome TaxID=1076179 RepID=A0A644WUL6_9ZZZZ